MMTAAFPPALGFAEAALQTLQTSPLTHLSAPPPGEYTKRCSAGSPACADAPYASRPSTPATCEASEVADATTMG